MTEHNPIETIHKIAQQIEASERDAVIIADLRREVERMRAEIARLKQQAQDAYTQKGDE